MLYWVLPLKIYAYLCGCARIVHIYVCIYPMTFPPFLHVVAFIEQLDQLRLDVWGGGGN